MAGDRLPQPAPGAPEAPRLAPLLRLAGPVIASRLGIMTMGLVDTVAVGRHSAEQLGFLALAWAPTGVVLTTAIGLLSGVQVLTSQSIGAGRTEETGAILRRGIVYAVWIGVAAALLLAGGGGWFMHHIGLPTALADGATPPLAILSLSLTLILVADAGIFWLEAHGRAVPGMIAMWAANVVNLGLNLWLVPGHSPFGVEGAVASGWSTFGARIALLAFVAAIVVAWPESRRYGVFRRPERDPAAGPALRRVGYAASLSYFIEAGSFSAMSIIAGWMGALAVATWAIVLNFLALSFMVPLGLAAATGVLVGRAHGAGHGAGVRRAAALGFGVTFAATLAISLGVALGNGLIADGYTRDAAVRAAAAAALLLSCLFFVADGLQVVAAQSLRAQDDIWMPTVTHSFSYIVVMLPLAYGFGIVMGGGVIGLVWAVILASLVSAALLWGRVLMVGRRAGGAMTLAPRSG